MAKYLSKDQRVIYPNANSGYGISEKQKICEKIRSIQYHFTYNKKRSEKQYERKCISLRLDILVSDIEIK